MILSDDPAPRATEPDPGVLVLPRPNLGPEPWSDPVAPWGVTGLIVGSCLVVAVLGLVGLRWRALRVRPAVGLASELGTLADADPTPSRRLIASSPAVRAALIAEFGSTWGARTTEEIAHDPALLDRLGPDLARAVVAYLERVDRVKFAGEEPEDADAWIESARSFLAQFPRRPG